MKLVNRFLLLSVSVLLLYSCSSNNVHQHNKWKKYFEGNGLTGSFMLHNTVLNTFELYNLQGTQNREIPGGSFDIMNIMAGLETGAATDTNMVMRDSMNSPLPGVDPGMTLGMAFRSSNQPYFQALADRIGKFKMQFWMDSVKYGNMTIGATLDSFWVNNTLKVSPDEQLGFLQELYYGKLPFQSRTQRLAKNLMLRTENVRYKLSYITGFCTWGGKGIGWIGGWIEESERPHFFVMQVSSPDPGKDLRAICFSTLHNILDEQGYFKKE